MRAAEDVAIHGALASVHALHRGDRVPAQDAREQRDGDERGEKSGADTKYQELSPVARGRAEVPRRAGRGASGP